MPYYRQVLLYQPKLAAKDLVNELKSCASIILQNNGVFRGIEHRGVQELGYAVEDRRTSKLVRHREGRLLIAHFNASPGALKQVERHMDLTLPLIRYQTFKSRDPWGDFLTHKMDPKEVEQQQQQQSSEFKQARVGIAKSQIPREGDFEVSFVDDDDEDFQQEVAAEFAKMEGDDDQSYDVPLNSRTKYIPHWKRDVLYDVTPAEEKSADSDDWNSPFN